MYDNIKTIGIKSMYTHGDNGYCDEMNYIDNFRACVRRLAEDLPIIMRRVGAVAVAVRGKSGVAMAHALALYLDINIIVVRKEGENSHGKIIEEWGKNHEKYIILDDFVVTGETCQQIINTLSGAKCVGVVTYRGASKGGYRENSSIYGGIQFNY